MRGVVTALALLTATPAAALDQTPDQLKATVFETLGAVLQADGPRARSLLASLPATGLEPRDEAFRACAVERLDPAHALPALAADAPFALKALDAYRAYWRAATNAPDARDAAEAQLVQRLGALIGRPELGDMEAIEPLVFERVEAEGFHALGGRTGNLLEMMLWSKEEARDVAVALPEGAHTTRVFLMDGFESQGWSNWLTCGRTGAGGWTKPEGLYAIVPAYASLEDENFSVNFLAHEAQHFADNAAWPDLPAWELEFRAKLTELALADTTRERVLGRFENSQGDDRDDSHSYANRRVLAALRVRLGLAPDADLKAVPAPVLREAAHAELVADTARREAAPA